jgi:hypothetical protein
MERKGERREEGREGRRRRSVMQEMGEQAME